MKKREFLKSVTLFAAGSAAIGNLNRLSAANSTVKKPKKKNIGLQIYSLGSELTDNVPEGLKRIADIGYSTIELAGYRDRKMGEYSVSEYKKLADNAGILITGSHVNPPVRNYTRDNAGEIADFWKQTVEEHVKLGVKTLVQPGMPKIESEDDAKMVCEVFNKAGEIAREAGIKWGYHNHSHEFERLDEKQVIYDLLLNGTDPSLVFFEMDVYWTVMGRNDPLEYFAKYPGRFPVLHIKDRKVLGRSGMMNFENIFTAAYKNGLDEFYVELEGLREEESQFEGVKECFEYLNEAPFVK